MPPEQAEGRISEVDEQSDVYSLGAILYEILTFRPPFEGTTAHNVLAKVISGDVILPSTRLSEIRKATGVETDDRKVRLPDTVSEDLDVIVLTAMAADKADRYSTVMDLHEEVQRFLDGEKERERNHEKALAKVAAGKILVEKMERTRTDLKSAMNEAEEEGRKIKSFWPVEKKEAFWAIEERVKRFRRVLVQTFTEAGNTLQEALTFERRNAEARNALADLYWDQYLREEEAGDEAEMVHYEKMVRQYNVGQHDARLKGDGSLTISSCTYPCRCLAGGREVAPNDMAVMGYHPISGRALAGHGSAEGLIEIEPKEPVHLKVHGPECKIEGLEGADAWLFRYEERDKILLPLFPKGVRPQSSDGKAIFAAVLDECFADDSPFRPGDGLHLGKTPVGRFAIPMGSYLLILHKEGFHPVRCPVNIGREADEELKVTLFRMGEIPAGFLQVPGGKFIYQGDKGNPFSGPKEIRETDDFFMAKYPVTCAEYLEFLNELADNDPEKASRRRPRESEWAGEYWPIDEDGHIVIPTKERLAEGSERLRKEARRLAHSPIDWEEDWPVFGITWGDSMAYSAWFSAKHEILTALPHEIMCEKATRGTDRRHYPFGNYFDDTYANSIRSHDGPPRPCPVSGFPVDESPYGVKGLCGNSTDWCISDMEGGRRRHLRGGAWVGDAMDLRAAFRGANIPRSAYRCGGLRLVALCRVEPKIASQD
jgi:formylglycine-generating enzyme required for sulfatase activity